MHKKTLRRLTASYFMHRNTSPELLFSYTNINLTPPPTPKFSRKWFKYPEWEVKPIKCLLVRKKMAKCWEKSPLCLWRHKLVTCAFKFREQVRRIFIARSLPAVGDVNSPLQITTNNIAIISLQTYLETISNKQLYYSNQLHKWHICFPFKEFTRSHRVAI